MIKFANTKFVKSAQNIKDFIIDTLPQIAFVGRSNVGKSSLINFLTNNKKMARISNTPGRTRLVNYFNVDNAFYLVDLPGYGYAAAARTQTSTWDDLLNSYFINNDRLKLVFVLLDCRRIPSELDIFMLNYLAENQIVHCVLLTKTDKLGKSDLNIQIEKIAAQIRHSKEIIIKTSAAKKLGLNQVAEQIEKAIN